MKNEKIIDGKYLAEQILAKTAAQIEQLVQQKKRIPGLAVVIVGDNPASKVYVNSKSKTCEKIGIKSFKFTLPENTSEVELLTLVRQLNNDSLVDGILVQLPLPKHLNSKIIIDNISPHKDVDGFHRYNIGSLTLQDPTICPCTPHGVIYMLDSIKFNYPGKHAVMIGASNIVGRPMALELLNRGCTVTICNSKTQNLPELTKLADLIVIAVGKPKMLQSDWVKADSVIIDVGMNRLDNGKLCGDADFDNLINRVSYITPVPGGVGLMTIAMLMQNTMECYLNN